MSLHKRLSAFRLSPHWGDNFKGGNPDGAGMMYYDEFQSPQWGDNSKGGAPQSLGYQVSVSVPAMGR